MPYERPAFWRVPRNDPPRDHDWLRERKKKVRFIDDVYAGTPADGELVRGDIVGKIHDYDGRDLTHQDAQQLFKNAGNSIHLVVHRSNRQILDNNLSNPSSRCASTVPPVSPGLLSPVPMDHPQRGPSPLPQYGAFRAALASPIDTLPHTVFPHLNSSGGYVEKFNPMPTRDHLQEIEEEATAIVNQPYRTTPLILPGAKAKHEQPTTESYLRHHPNPAMRGPVHHLDDVLMKQKVADSVLHRVVGDDARTGKVFHKQFNSPIGLYSDSNIENTIKQTVPTTPYKKTVVFDPSKSETYRALQEEGYGNQYPREINIPVQHQTYQPNRLVPGKKPVSSYPPANPQYNSGDDPDAIHQSGSFKRLMYSVMGNTDY